MEEDQLEGCQIGPSHPSHWSHQGLRYRLNQEVHGWFALCKVKLVAWHQNLGIWVELSHKLPNSHNVLEAGSGIVWTH